MGLESNASEQRDRTHGRRMYVSPAALSLERSAAHRSRLSLPMVPTRDGVPAINLLIIQPERLETNVSGRRVSSRASRHVLRPLRTTTKRPERANEILQEGRSPLSTIVWLADVTEDLMRDTLANREGISPLAISVSNLKSIRSSSLNSRLDLTMKAAVPGPKRARRSY